MGPVFGPCEMRDKALDKYQQGSKRSINDDLEREPRSIKISLPKTPWTQIHLRPQVYGNQQSFVG